MGNNISLEENENEHENEDRNIQSQSNDVEMKSVSPRENSNNDNDIQPTTVKKSKRILSDAVKKRRATSKNCNANAYKKTKSSRRR
jgi:hypothetical protein